ncbi:NAD(P)-dependent oxidoreductase [Halobacterium sp. R2-5]|uniref:NAD-dependent epimerase/dehydratase family protein n=1 Tax=Halobacterium sp. R2-5 TaxID=2715751 RepID=UPI00142242E2|nr:NAD(P)-dependent oxidoreductase [Halobacterium sp. R2-5]NIB98651.1 NAD(P)-dependent oxidoreductase [Halobacterium sp. R2-5]
MRVLITGANGTVGSAILDQLGDREEYEFTCLDVEDHPDRETVVADITDLDDLRGHFEGHDAVVHLAALVDLNASWGEILQHNVVGTYNVLQAAAEAEVEKFVFASSIHTVGMYEIELAPELYDPDYDLAVTHEDPVRPDSFYGLSKVFGEAAGRLFVESQPNPLGDLHPTYETNTRDYPTSFYSLRIKTVVGAEYDHPYGLAEMGVDEGWWDEDSEAYEYVADRMKCTWLSHRDLGQLVDRCLQDETVDYDVFWGVSDNDGTWVDGSHARDVLGYEPQDNGGEWTAPPESET